VFTVPAEATTQNGLRPAARSAATAFAKPSADRRRAPSTGTSRRLSVPSPKTSTLLRTQEWASLVA
jgi:hypothetical protein